MIQKINLHPTARKRQVLISYIIAMTLALATSCTPARQMATQTTPSEKAMQPTESVANDETDIVDENTDEIVKEEPPVRKQRLTAAPFKALAREKTETPVDSQPNEEETEALLTENASETLPAPQSEEKSVHSNSHARFAQNNSNEKLEEVLVQLVEQHETIIHLMQEQMTAQKEIAASTQPTPAANARQEFIEEELYEEPASNYAQKTVLEEVNNSHEVRVSIAPDRSIVLDEELLIEWENTVAAMENGTIPRTKLPAWILQGLEWLTHAPSHEPERSQILMPLYRHMQFAGHLSSVNMNSMSPADVVRILRVFVNEMKARKGQIHKA